MSSSILKRPGWNHHEMISEKISIGDIQRVIPGWGPGKEAKRFFANKIGDEVPTGRLGAKRKVGGTSYREAELAFSRFLASSLQIAENVIATKEVKAILRDISEDMLRQYGFDSVDDWLDAWVEYAQDKFGLDLTNLATRRAVKDIAQQAETIIGGDAEITDDLAAGDVENAATPITDDNQLPPELRERFSVRPIQVQNAEVSDDDQTFTKLSFMGQEGGDILFVRLKNVPKDQIHKAALRAVNTAGDLFDNLQINGFITQVEHEKDGRSNIYSFSPASKTSEKPEDAPVAPDEDPQEDDFKIEVESTRLGTRSRAILTEQMRIARKQQIQRVEEFYRW